MKTQVGIVVLFGLLLTFQCDAQQRRAGGGGRAMQRPAAPMHRPVQRPVQRPAQPVQRQQFQNNRANIQSQGSAFQERHPNIGDNQNIQNIRNNPAAREAIQERVNERREDTTSVYYPYGYYQSYDYVDPETTAEYPNSYYICYSSVQTDETTVHTTCPLPVRWYSTNPGYNTPNDSNQYRPEYVCPQNNAPGYKEFSSSYDAVTWANNNCNRDARQ